MRRVATFLLGGAVALALPIGLLAVIGMREAASTPVERRLTLKLPGWPAATPPVTIALLSDIHIGNRAMDSGRLDAIVERVNAARPDLVLIAGDFIVGHDAVGARENAASLQRPLSRLRARLGVVAVLGNHDYWTAPDAIRAVLRRAGITVLANQAVRRGPVAIIGIDDAYSGHDDVAAAMSSWRRVGGIPLVLTHSPDLVHELRGGFPLVMAGHTHCGQVVLPGFGPVLMRAPREHWRKLYDPRYRCGVVRDAHRLVVVTAGLGSGTSPIRLGAPPDWWLLKVGSARD